MNKGLKRKLINNHKDNNNPNWKGGITKKEYYCNDCREKIHYHTALYGNNRCSKCANKNSIKLRLSSRRSYKKQKNPNHRHGKCNKKHYCIVCDKELSDYRAIYCNSCVRKGKLSPFYIEDLIRKYPNNFNDKLKEQIRFRDYYECQTCGIKQENYYRKLDVHHIDYDKENLEVNNLISLCSKCNINANYNKDYWYAYFMYIMEDIYGI